MRASQKVQKGTVVLGGKELDYSVRRSTSSSRRRIRVTPTSIEVVVPSSQGKTEAVGFLRENEAWVLEQVEFVERASGLRRAQPKPASLLLRGKDKSISIAEENTTRRYGIVSETDDEIILRVPQGRRDLAGRALELFLRRLARLDLNAAVGRRAREMRLRFGRVYIMNQRTRWGGCSSRRNLSFNWRLIMAPPSVLDYLAVHELVHLKEPNHTTRFWLIVQSICPDFVQYKRWLKENEWRLQIPTL